MNGAKSRGSMGMGGFTIVETMIVLAVSGLIMAAAVLTVVGQQNKVEFNQSIQDIQSNIQQVMSEISSGYYPNPGNLRCDGNAGTVNLSTSSGAQGTQGSNTGCIFVGKALQFGSGNDPQKFVTHTIAGLQDNTGTLASAKPKAVARGLLTNNNSDMPDASLAKPLLYGLQAVSMNYIDGAVRQPIGAVAFVSSLGKYESGLLQSGTPQLSLVPVTGSGAASGGVLSTDSARVADAINNNLATSPINPSGGVEICFQSGGTNQSGLITLGSNGRAITTKLEIKSTKDCS